MGATQVRENVQMISEILLNLNPLQTEFYQTDYARETVCIITDPDGSISIGFARAGRLDIEKRKISKAEGMTIAEGRAKKARTMKTPLIKKNYLRRIYLKKVEND